MKTLINDAWLINEGVKTKGSLLIDGDKIEKIFSPLLPLSINFNEVKIIEAEGLYLIPGVIDDQVHFREPGYTHKGDISTESRAAIAGGITSFMEMPNTNPQTITQKLLEEKYELGSKVSAANYSFYMGTTNDNLHEVFKTDAGKVCGIKVFMGSSTGNMLVDDEQTLSELFRHAPTLIATHCEDEQIINANTLIARKMFGENVPFSYHPTLRSDEACFKSSEKAVKLASRFGNRLHVLHLSTKKEMELFTAGKVTDKNITAEVCVHHLWFDERDYEKYGSRIKWNPSIKAMEDKEALWEALLSDKIDVIATDHAPHTIEEKNNSYFKSPSGGPLVQHSLVAMLEMSRKGYISVEKVIEKMCHAPARLFKINKRGFLREGYFADLVLINPDKNWAVSKENILYKCGWSPFEGTNFSNCITHTFINGELAFCNGAFLPVRKGKRLTFDL